MDKKALIIGPSSPGSSDFKRCGVCGGQLVNIRGRYPRTEKREVCPTCLAERMDQIREVSSPDYGKSAQNTGAFGAIGT